MIRLRALGQCIVEVGEHHVTPESDVLFALLLYLISTAGQAVSRTELLELLWPESAPNSARHRLRQALYQLKKLGVPLTTPDSVVAVRESDVEADYDSLSRGRNPLSPSAWQGRLDYLPTYRPTFSHRFSRWVDGERDRVRGNIRRYLLDEIAEKRARGEHAPVVSLARACLDLDPLNGDATFALAEALAVQGRRAEALGILDQHRVDRQATDHEAWQATASLRRAIIDLARKPLPSAVRDAPLAGRSEILAILSTWIASSTEAARILAIVGEAGIGKTRLLSEGVRVATLRGIRSIEYRASAAGGERPLAGLLDLLPQLLALPGAVGCSPESFAWLTDLAKGIHEDNSVPEDQLDSAFRFATLRRSVLDLIEAVLAEGQLLLSLDDAHALDRPTLEILVDATRCHGHRFAIMIGMRPIPAAMPFLEPRSDVRLLRVPRLDLVDARSIVAHDLTAEDVAKRSRLIDWAVDLADGNPFFLVELSAHCRHEDASESLPESLQIALDRRIDALAPISRLLLQSCALLAEQSTLGRLETMLGLPAHAIAAALSELDSCGLIVLRNGRVVCRHDLVADAVLRSVSNTLGSYLHRRCAALLDDELRTSPSASLAWDCARHWDAAAEHARALELTGVIVDQLVSLGLPKEAADLCVRAERYCQTPEQHADRHLRLSRARRLLYDWEGVVESLAQRRALLASARVRPQRFSDDEVCLFEARWWRDCDGHALQRAVRRVADSRAPALHRLQMAVFALIVADNQHRRQEAERIAEVVDSLEAHNLRESIERSKAQLIYHTAFGGLDLARTIGLGLVETERRDGNSAALLRALRWASVPLRFTNDEKGSLAMLTEAYQSASRLALRGEMWNAAFYLQGLALDFEDLDLALTWAPILGDLDSDATVHPLRAFDRDYTSARIEYMRGDFAQARVFLERSRRLKSRIPRARGEHVILALDVLLRVRTSKRVPRPVLTRLCQLHLKTRDSGVRDFETAAVVAGLLHSGHRREAQDINDYYMSVRRSRITNHATLHKVQSELALGATL